jgi:hypothetical protein
MPRCKVMPMILYLHTHITTISTYIIHFIHQGSFTTHHQLCFWNLTSHLAHFCANVDNIALVIEYGMLVASSSITHIISQHIHPHLLSENFQTVLSLHCYQSVSTYKFILHVIHIRSDEASWCSNPNQHQHQTLIHHAHGFQFLCSHDRINPTFAVNSSLTLLPCKWISFLHSSWNNPHEIWRWCTSFHHSNEEHCRFCNFTSCRWWAMLIPNNLFLEGT